MVSPVCSQESAAGEKEHGREAGSQRGHDGCRLQKSDLAPPVTFLDLSGLPLQYQIDLPSSKDTNFPTCHFSSLLLTLLVGSADGHILLFKIIYNICPFC
jgi:hypothetical protein